MSQAAITTLLSVLAGIGGLSGAAALFKVFFDRTTIRADAVEQIADTSVKMLTPLHDEIDRLSGKLRAAEGEVDELRRQVRKMAESHDEAETLRSKLRSAERNVDDLRAQCRRLYEEMAQRDQVIAEKNGIIERLRASGFSGTGG